MNNCCVITKFFQINHYRSYNGGDEYLKSHLSIFLGFYNRFINFLLKFCIIILYRQLLLHNKFNFLILYRDIIVIHNSHQLKFYYSSGNFLLSPKPPKNLIFPIFPRQSHNTIKKIHEFLDKNIFLRFPQNLFSISQENTSNFLHFRINS